MYYNINYEVTAIVILIIMICTRYRYFKSESSIIRQYMGVISLVLFTALVNIMAALSYNGVIPSTDKLLLLIETVYLILALISCYLQVDVIAMRFSKNYTRLRAVNFIFVALAILILCINMYSRFIFEYVNHEFIGYPAFNGIYVIYVLLFLEMAGLMLYKRGQIRTQTLILTSSIMIFPIICILIQFIDDRIILSEFGATIAFFIYSFSLEDQDYDRLQQTLSELEESKKAESENREEITRVNKVKNLFMEKVSEELVVPIEDLLNSSETILQTDNVPSEMTEYAKHIQENGKQLLDFVDRLIEVSKEETDYE